MDRTPAFQAPLVYNLFPRLAGPLDRWLEHVERAAAMGFNWLYVNPIHQPGFSGSLYAIKDYERLNPLFLPAGSRDDRLETVTPTLRRITELGLRPVVDLVVNHTAKDSPLIEKHPDWYLRGEDGEVESPYAVDPDNPSKATAWGDLAEIDNASSPDREALWQYWADLVRRYVEVGFRGFRCDAAYKVPADLWQRLVDVAAGVDPEARFFAETLGCTLQQARALRSSGLHYFFNSSKWWDFSASWCLEQHHEFEDIPSLSFPESHDTQRLAEESGGRESVQRQRYAFAAAFSTGLMMPIGYEFGFRKKLDVVRTTPDDWEQPAFDLQRFIAEVNRLKLETPLLHGEGEMHAAPSPEHDVLVLERRTPQAPGEVGYVLVNRDWHGGRRVDSAALPTPSRSGRLVYLDRDSRGFERESVTDQIDLRPAGVALILARDDS